MIALGKEEAIQRIRAGMKADDSSPDAPPSAPPAVAETDPAARAANPKPKFFADVNMGKPKEESGEKTEKGPGIFKRGLKHAVDQLNPIKAFKEIRENWRKSGAQFNEELFEEKQIEMFFQDIPEAERENYGYSRLLLWAKDIDQMRGSLFEEKNKKREQFAGIFSALGIKRDVVDDDDIKRLESDNGDRHKMLMEAGMKAFANDPKKLEKFLNQFDQKDVAFREENLEAYFRAQNGKYGDKIVYGLDRIGRTFKEIGLLRKMAITSIGTGGVVIGGAVLGFGALGVSSMMVASRIGISALGGLSLGIGKKLKYEGRRRTQEDMAKVEHIKETLQAMEKNIDEGIQEMHKSFPVGKLREMRAENIFKDNRKAALWGAISAVLGRAAGEYLAYEGITFRSLLEKIGIAGGGTIKPNVSDHIPEVAKPSVIAEPEVKVGGSLPSLEPNKLSPETFEQIQRGFEDANPDKHLDDAAKNISKMYAGAVEPDVKTGGIPEDFQKPSAVPEPEAKTGDMRAPDASSKIADLKIRDIAAMKIKAGGTMWGSIESNIKANPSAYGLDPDDPSFTKDMHRMTQQMLDEFASRKGMSYEQLDQIARTKLRAGDTFKIIHDPLTRDIYIDDFQGKTFGADVSPGGAGAAQEIAPSKGSIPIEDMKPKASAAEHQPSRGAGEQQQAARLEAVNEMANSRLYLSTRGLINQLVNGAGVGDRANFFDQPMSSWEKLLGTGNRIAEDPQFIDQTNKLNLNFNKLKDLFPILEKYHRQGIESIGDCLKEAVKDPKNVYMINKLILRK